MTSADLFMLALCLWREARGEGEIGQIAVGCVIRNRVAKRTTSYYAEVVRPWQFSSITAKGDPQLSLYPSPSDAVWKKCQDIANSIVTGETLDPTGGATLYYADYIPFPPTWDKTKVVQTVKINHHIFFREVA